MPQKLQKKGSTLGMENGTLSYQKKGRAEEKMVELLKNASINIGLSEDEVVELTVSGIGKDGKYKLVAFELSELDEFGSTKDSVTWTTFKKPTRLMVYKADNNAKLKDIERFFFTAKAILMNYTRNNDNTDIESLVSEMPKLKLDEEEKASDKKSDEEEKPNDKKLNEEEKYNDKKPSEGEEPGDKESDEKEADKFSEELETILKELECEFDKNRYPFKPEAMAVGKTETKVAGELLMYDVMAKSFKTLEKSVTVEVIKTKELEYYMNVYTEKTDIISQFIEPKMNAMLNSENKTIGWNSFDRFGVPYSLSLVFPDVNAYSTLLKVLVKAAYEFNNKMSWEKISERDRQYITNTTESALDPSKGLQPSSNENSEEGFSDSGYTSETEDEALDEEDRSEDEIYQDSSEGYESDESSQGINVTKKRHTTKNKHPIPRGGTRKQNTQLVVGYKDGRSYVLQGNDILVYGLTNRGKLKKSTTIDNITDTKNITFTPEKLMLHNQDSVLVLTNKENPNSLFKMDLEVGKVVEEWKLGDYLIPSDIVPESRYAQTTPTQTFVGISHNSLFKIDPRLPTLKVGESQIQQYSSKLRFTSVATTSEGNLVVGSGKGELRLFDRVGVKAKTSLPALGEPIIGVDVTSDGRYVIATCRSHILLIDTLLPPTGDSSKHKLIKRTGFLASFPQNAKPMPKRLYIRPEHLVLMNQKQVSFTPAKFNLDFDYFTSSKRVETTIVASSGPYVITWNLNKVLKSGKGDVYSIKKHNDVIVAGDFVFGHDNSIVVTMPYNVDVVKKRQFSKPDKL
ncbi:Vacuolar import and degradation protein 27 [Zancudomyces culisetae]|uniref:Vacuolar import and degradation protein 27 n=1 Tax=Zancudomyces culisetae TaxID=1213189 RepID=A0A1R1PEK4_ZANCU|nr:Vacuolar import and degradation protein 27 [Zancudomyces culisetae]|eukprot:OMH79391.1 Vacuolar import and degradation protein 27 [Zancudomyces culisetae]